MAPPAPAWFSTTKVWPIAVRSRSARMRATRSTPPPGACGAMIFTGRVGYASCARACGAALAASITAAAARAARPASTIRVAGRVLEEPLRDAGHVRLERPRRGDVEHGGAHGATILEVVRRAAGNQHEGSARRVRPGIAHEDAHGS